MVNLKEHIAEVQDFPKKDIMFYDISPLLRNHFSAVIEQLQELFSVEEWDSIDCIAGVESRGFTLAAGLAVKLNKNFIHIRKAGKLPGNIESMQYGLEYGSDCLEMQHGSGKVIIIDDVLATGGTLKAAADLAHQTGHEVVGIGVLINLPTLNNFSWKSQKARQVLSYE